MSMKLISEAKDWHKMWSMRLMAGAVVAEALQRFIPVWSELLPGNVESWLTASLITLAMAARLISQELAGAQQP